MCGYTIDESTSRIPARQACRAKLQRDRDDILDGENNRHRGMQSRLFMRQLLGEHVVKESQVQEKMQFHMVERGPLKSWSSTGTISRS